MEEIVATAGVVVLDGDHVLLIEHGEGAGHVTGAWGIPAGATDGGETPRAAAVRELAEETGLPVDAGVLVELPTVYEARIRRKTDWGRFSARVFATDRYEGEVTPSDEGAPTWIPVDEVVRLQPLLANTAEIVQGAVRLLTR